MGNRAVITTKENFDNDGVGIDFPRQVENGCNYLSRPLTRLLRRD